LGTRIESEIVRLRNLNWKIPSLDADGIYTPIHVNEELISFPSEDYSGEESNSEASGFWAEERALAIEKMLNERGVNLLWEIGAGNGNAAIPLRNKGIEVVCVEPLRSGTLTLVKNGFLAFQSTLETLALPDDSIEAVGAFDVLEHLEYPEILIREIFRILKPGGYFICSVPAYQWLFSDFDLSIGHYRRYSRKRLNQELSSVGFNDITKKSIFGFLVFPAFLIRRIPFILSIGQDTKRQKVKRNSKPSILNKLSPFLKILSRLEQKVNLPFGLTHIAGSTKRE
jgi:SAM-dependent methyltransferase